MPTPRKPAARRRSTPAPSVRRVNPQAHYTDQAPPIRTRYGSPVEAVPAARLKNHLGAVLRQALTQQVLAITRHNETYAMILSVEEYRTLLRFAPPPLKALEKEFDALVKRMQTKKSRRAMDALFRATPEELGRAAHRAAQSKGSKQARTRKGK